MIAGGGPSPEDVALIAKRYGLEFGRPDWLPDVIERYGLTPPPIG